MRPEHHATSPLVWVATQLGRFICDGYREIRALIASNTPHSLKKVFTGSLAALVLENTRLERGQNRVVDRAAFFAAKEQRKIEERDLTQALAETGGKDSAAFKEVDWTDVVLCPDTEADLRNLVRLMDPACGERLKLAMPTGLLLIGPPGTGKTMIARLIATQTKRSFYPITSADILGGAAGASVKKLKELFTRARENSPSIIFIDEMDGCCPATTVFSRSMISSWWSKREA